MERKIFQKYRIQNSNGLYAEISDFGAKILGLHVPDKQGVLQDILIGFDEDEHYYHHDPYFNGICGRFAGRIGEATFMLNGKKVEVSKNAGKHQLHGGFKGFHVQFWEVEKWEEHKITLNYFSKDGEEGFPGNLKVSVTYEWDNDNQFITTCKATTDQPTVVNMCQHAYFNLNGAGSIKEHLLHLHTERFTEFDDQFINTGNFLSVENTSLDFRAAKTLNAIDQDPFFGPTLGIDHCFEIRKGEEKNGILHACTLGSSQSGIQLDVFTNQPALVVYTGNYIEEQVGKRGTQNGKHTAICLETQAFSNAPNCDNFPSTQLNPEESYLSITCWKFSIERMG